MSEDTINIGLAPNFEKPSKAFWQRIQQGIWRTSNGDVLSIHSMEPDHLKNVIGWLQRHLKNVDDLAVDLANRILAQPSYLKKVNESLQTLAEHQGMYERAIIVFKQALKDQEVEDELSVEARTPLATLLATDGGQAGADLLG